MDFLAAWCEKDTITKKRQDLCSRTGKLLAVFDEITGSVDERELEHYRKISGICMVKECKASAFC